MSLLGAELDKHFLYTSCSKKQEIETSFIAHSETFWNNSSDSFNCSSMCFNLKMESSGSTGKRVASPLSSVQNMECGWLCGAAIRSTSGQSETARPVAPFPSPACASWTAPDSRCRWQTRHCRGPVKKREVSQSPSAGGKR